MTSSAALEPHYDVAILGGGPAGAATALKLKKTRPDLSILLVERSKYEKHRIGESLPPGTKSLLDELDAWPAFEQLAAKPTYGIQSAWGQTDTATNDFLFHTSGHGWVVDRRAFDERLASLAEERGVILQLQTQLHSAVKENDWKLTLVSGSETKTVRASFVVDASGRSAKFARAQGAQPVRFDQLVGIYGTFTESQPAPTLIEAFSQGWWYSASLPNGQRLVSCFTDADLARDLKHSWQDQLAKTQQTLRSISGPALTDLRTAPAHSQRLDQVTGDGWLAVGDAASTYDPLSSQGIFKGLRSGIFAAYALSDTPRTLEKYERFIADEFEGYLETRAQFYAEERRWSSSPFWHRRLDQVTLDPHTLVTSKSSPRRFFHLTPAQTNTLLSHCQSPTPAHHLVSVLQSRSPSLSAHRIILGLQHLLQAKVLSSPSSALASSTSS